MHALYRMTLGIFALCVLFFGLSSNAAAASMPQVKVETTAGDFVIELNPQKAPETVRNFLYYVKTGGYDGTIFHRVIDGFMIQGGGFDENMNKRPTRKTITNEASNGLKNKKYTIAMARLSAPHSASNQFFINVADNANLDYRSSTPSGFGYAVFGRVIKGMNVIDAIKGVPTGNKMGHQNVPLKPVIIKSIVPVQ